MSLDVNHFIEGFVKATKETFSVMANTEISSWQTKVDHTQNSYFDISGIIGLSGSIRGMVAISMPKELAIEIASALHGENFVAITNEVSDTVGEIVNVLAGAAKRHIKTETFLISLPNVIIGHNHKIQPMKSTESYIIQMLTASKQEMFLELSIKKE